MDSEKRKHTRPAPARVNTKMQNISPIGAGTYPQYSRVDGVGHNYSWGNHWLHPVNNWITPLLYESMEAVVS